MNPALLLRAIPSLRRRVAVIQQGRRSGFPGTLPIRLGQIALQRCELCSVTLMPRRTPQTGLPLCLWRGSR